jgi:hypothetical protein
MKGTTFFKAVRQGKRISHLKQQFEVRELYIGYVNNNKIYALEHVCILMRNNLFEIKKLKGAGSLKW